MESEHETVTEPLIDLRHHGAVVIDLGVVVDVRPVDSAVALLHQLHDFGVQVAVFSQTGDAQAVLDTVGLGESFLVGGSPTARLKTSPPDSIHHSQPL